MFLFFHGTPLSIVLDCVGFRGIYGNGSRYNKKEEEYMYSGP
jgi:hypothetical protein